MPKPLSPDQQDELFLQDPMAMGLETAYQTHEKQLRSQIKSGRLLPFQVKEDIAKLRRTLAEHFTFRRQLRQRGLIK